MPEHPSETLTVCRACRIHHYDNCPDCLGFGQLNWPLTSGGACPPVTAGEAHGDAIPAGGWRPCPTCGSTPAGVPKETQC